MPLPPPTRPGYVASYKLVYQNVGNQVESGTLNFTFDDTKLGFISADKIPDLIVGGNLKRNFNNLISFEKREITIKLKVNTEFDLPAVNIGDKLYLDASSN